MDDNKRDGEELTNGNEENAEELYDKEAEDADAVQYLHGNIENVEIGKEVRSAFIEYAMSVIIDRALPDVRDGLKPVHRRILYAMNEDGLTYNKAYHKSAATVGNVLGRYHPHGDSAVYDAMVRLAQDFSMRYPLIDGHGNFGNVDGDPAAAYRYTEARMSKIADEMVDGLDKNVVDFMPNFDNKRKEPTVLPSKFPNLLVNGSVGIAVGMATNIPPHNLGEVIDGAVYLLDNPDCTISDLMNFIKGPDFPTKATIHGTSGIYEAYSTGRGRILVRSKAEIVEKKGKTSIHVTEIPYQVNKSKLVSDIADLVRDKRVEGITDIRDESDRHHGMRIVIDVRRDANAQVILNQLYKYTQLQDTFAANMLALVGGEPKVLNLKEMLHYYLLHQMDVLCRRLRFDLEKAERRAHIVEGLKLAIDNIDEVIKIIRASKTIPDARDALIARFAFTDIQAQEIVAMPLGRLSGLEIDKLLEELASLIEKIKEIKETLADEVKLNSIIKNDLEEIKRRFGDERRTAIEAAADDIVLEDLIDRHECVVTISHAGYIKRLPADTYSAQKRGGKGIIGMQTKEEDFVEDVLVSNSHNYIMMFTNLGKVFVKKCYEIPEAGRTSKGTNLVNILGIENGEKVTAAISLESFDSGEYLTMVTKNGVIKRTGVDQYKNFRKAGLIAINLDEGDELLYVLRTGGDSDILVATRNALAARFSELGARSLGRTARGVKAIDLAEGDCVVGAVAIAKDDTRKIITITENGFGKRTDPEEFPRHNRGGKGVICHKLADKTGALVGISAVDDGDDIMLITDSGTIIRTRVSEIPVYNSRSTSGVIVMRLDDDTKISGFATLAADDKDEDNAEADGDTGAADATIPEATETTENNDSEE